MNACACHAAPRRLGEEDKKAAKAAQSARQLEQQQKNLGSVLTRMGIGRRTFGSLSALGRPGGAAQRGAGFTKAELEGAKAELEGDAKPSATDGAAGAAAPGGSSSEPAAAAPATEQSTQQQGTDGNTAPAAPPQADGAPAPVGGSATAGSAAPAPPPAPRLRPVTLAHDLLAAAGPTVGGVPAFVAGGASSGRAAEGEEHLRELMIADLIAALERHPLYCRSHLLHALYATLPPAPLPGAAVAASGAVSD